MRRPGASGVAPPRRVDRADRFRVLVLGPFALYRGDKALDPGTWPPRAQSLLKLVVTAPDHRRSRDEIVDSLWPEAPAAAGAANLRYTLHLLRRMFGDSDPSPILSEKHLIALNPAYEWEVDLDQLGDVARTTSADPRVLERAAQLYRGEPLIEDRYADWAVPVRERIQRIWRDVCLRLAALHRTQGTSQDAAGWYERILESDPLDEEAMRGLLDVLRALRRHTDALRHYQQFARRLDEELGVPPGPEILAIAAQLEQQLAPPAPLPRGTGGGAGVRPVPVVPSYPLPATGALVGRAAELRALLAALSRVARGAQGAEPSTPRMVLLAAEAGMGKTRLLAEAAQRARDGGFLTLAGGCYEQEGRLPYSPIHDALLDYVHAQPEAVLHKQLDAVLPELMRIIPELREHLPAREAESADPESRRLRLFSSIGQALSRIARDGPLLLLLDDLHWVDEATLQLLHFLLRQPHLERVLIIGTYRAEEVAMHASLERFLAETQTAGRTEVLALQPLSREELAAILEERLGGQCAEMLIESIHCRGGGNPFFALEMLQLLRQEGQLEQVREGWQIATGVTPDIPLAVRETVARRLRRLGPDEREALTLGAVLGREFGYAQVEALWQGSERELFRALDAALDARVLVEMQEGYGFQHPLLWEVVYYRTPTPRRTLLHERAALALERLYGDRAEEHAAELAHHLISAGRVHLERAAQYLIAAGDQAERVFAHAEAEQHYRGALGLVRQRGNERRLAEVAEKLGCVLRYVGRQDEALELLEQAAYLYATHGDLEAEGRVVAQIGWAYYFALRTTEGLARLEPLVQKLEAHGVLRSLALLYGPLPRLRGEVEGPAAEIAAAERAADLARAVGDDGLLAGAEMRRGRGLGDSGRPDEALEVLEGAIALAEKMNDLFVLTASHFCASRAYYRLGQLDRAMWATQRGVECAERREGREQLTTGVYGSMVDFALLSGAWTEARTYAERFLSMAQAQGNPSRLVEPLLRLGALCLHEGALEQATRYLEDSSAISRPSGMLPWIPEADVLLAQIDLLKQDPGAALARLHPLLTQRRCEHDINMQIVLAESYLAVGRLAEAGNTVSSALRQAIERQHPPRHVDALRVQGMVMARQGWWTEAKSLLTEAATMAHPMPYPYGAARSLYELGRLSAARGEVEQARERLEEALTIFWHLGARLYIVRTEQALDALAVQH